MNLTHLDGLPPRQAAFTAYRQYDSLSYAAARLANCEQPSTATKTILLGVRRRSMKMVNRGFDDLWHELMAEVI